jgi:propanol-preferring alcohol dehydrogenase
MEPRIPSVTRAWVVERPGPISSGPLRRLERPVPAPGPYELLVRVRVCAVCRTDLHLAEGDLPPRKPHCTPGHQVVGEVIAAGSAVEGFSPGDRVGIAWLAGTRPDLAGGQYHPPSTPGYDGVGHFAQ